MKTRIALFAAHLVAVICVAGAGGAGADADAGAGHPARHPGPLAASVAAAGHARLGEVLNHVNPLTGGETPNHNPLFDAGPQITVTEDSGIFGPRQWAENIVDGDGPLVAGRPTNGGNQGLWFTVVAVQAFLFDGAAGQPTITNNGFLSFTPAPDQCGSTEVTVELNDDGNKQCVDGTPAGAPAFICPGACQPTDCSVSVQVTFTITIQCVNDAPRFSDLGDVTSKEDGGSVRINNWAFNINKGAADSRAAITNFELEQLLIFDVSVTRNPGLFSIAPAIIWNPQDPLTADLTYQAAPGQCGTAEVVVTLKDNGGTANGGSDTMAPRTFQITVECDNDPPSFTCGGAVTILEDFGPFTQSNWASQISKGNDGNDANENAQQLFFDLVFLNPSDANLFLVAPAVDPSTGALTFQAKPNANTGGRNVELYVRLRDTGGMSPRDSSCDPISLCCKLVIVITPVNDPPTFTCGGDIIVCEDLVNLPVAPTPPIYTDGTGWAKNIGVGASNEGVGLGGEGQVVQFTLRVSDPTLFVSGPALDAAGTLSFQLAENANGVTTVTVTSADTGPTGPPGSNVGPSCTFTITVRAVSDPPTFTLPPNPPLIVNEDDPPSATDFPTFITQISRGPTDEAGQQITFQVENNNNALFKVQPRLEMISTNTARLAFELAPDACGQADLFITATDTGDIDQCNGKGSNMKRETYTIKVECKNDVPTFRLGPACCAKQTTCTGEVCAITLCEDEAVNGYTAPGFATLIRAGPDKFDENLMSVAFTVNTDNPGMFSTAPQISPSGTLTFTTAKDAFGSALMTVTLTDDGTPTATSDPQTYSITVRASNDPPVFSIRSDLLGTAVRECVAPYDPRGCSIATTAPGCARTFPNWIFDAAPGPSNEGLQGVTFSVDVDDASRGLFTVPPSIDSAGTLSFTTKPGANTAAPISLVITAKDDGASIQGGTMNGQAACPGTDTTVKTLRLEILPVNNPPCFTCGGNKEVLEDSGPATFLSAVTDVTAGPGDESVQTLSFTLTPDKPFLFSDVPKIDPATGTLTFQPGPNQCGSTIVNVQLDDGQPSDNMASCQITITIVPVNDQPSFTGRGEVTVNEDNGPTCIEWVKTSTAGALEDFTTGTCDRQTVRYELQNTNKDLFLVQPTLSSKGELCFHPAKDYCGTSTVDVTMVDSGGVAHSGIDRSDKQSFPIVVTCINDAPTFNKGSNLVVCEDGGPQLAPQWCSEQSPGPLVNENCPPHQQLLTFHVTADKPELFVIQPAIDRDTCSLSFTGAANANGVSTVTVTLCDNGNSVPPNMNCAPAASFTISIRAVNDAPSFRKGADISVLEDVPPQYFPAWAKEILKGPVLNPGSEVAQTLDFRLKAVDPTLFRIQPAISPVTGDLTFTLAADANGETKVDACLVDNGGTFLTSRMGEILQSNPGKSVCPNGVDSFCDFFTVSVKACNDPPRFLQAPDVEVSEDSGGQVISRWMEQLAPGPDDERHQIIKVVQLVVPQEKRFLFSQLPSLSVVTGDLTFTPAPDVFGTATVSIVLQDNGGTEDSCVDTTRKSFDITIKNVNDLPSFTRGPHVVVLEDAPRHSIAWASAITPGPFEESQTVRFTTSASVPELFAEQPAISAIGVLTFVTAPDANGLTPVSVILSDGAGGTSDTTLTSIEIVPVNDPPTFKRGVDVTVLEDAAPVCLKGWASDVSPGPANEKGQVVSFSVVSRSPVAFLRSPTLDAMSGDLCFSLAPDVSGDIVVDITASDSGGTSNGGRDTALPVAFSMSIVPVNDAPFFLKGADITVFEDASDMIFTKWATMVSAGPLEQQQTVSFATVCADVSMFTVVPKIWENTGDLVFTLAPNRNGETRVDVVLTDNGGTANGGQNVYRSFFYITVRPVNDRPSFVIGTDIQVNEAKENAVNRVVRPRWASSLSPGPPDEVNQMLRFTVEVDKPGMFVLLPTISTPSGDLEFELVPDVNGVVTVRVALMDDGGVENGGIDRTDTASFKINVVSINDMPTFTAGDRLVRVPLNSGTSEQLWATRVSAGPSDENQAVTFQLNVLRPDLFTAEGQPAIMPDGRLRFTPAPNVIGNSTVIVTAVDSSGTTSVPVDFVIVVYNPAQTPQPTAIPLLGEPPSSSSSSFPLWGIPLVILAALLLLGACAAGVFLWMKRKKERRGGSVPDTRHTDDSFYGVHGAKGAAPIPSDVTGGVSSDAVTEGHASNVCRSNPIERAFAADSRGLVAASRPSQQVVAGGSSQQQVVPLAGPGFGSSYIDSDPDVMILPAEGYPVHGSDYGGHWHYPEERSSRQPQNPLYEGALG